MFGQSVAEPIVDDRLDDGVDLGLALSLLRPLLVLVVAAWAPMAGRDFVEVARLVLVSATAHPHAAVAAPVNERFGPA